MASRQTRVSGIRRKPQQASSQERVNHILDVAEELFVAQGFGATSTNEIAKKAQVPIGSLYQFFSDKKAIVLLLMERYNRLLHERLALADNAELVQLSLPEYVSRLIDITSRFFDDHPGYHAMFMETQGSVPELRETEDAADAQLIVDLAASLAGRGIGDGKSPSTSPSTADLELMALVLVKAITPLIWLSRLQEPEKRLRMVAEIKRLALGYLSFSA
ncbi:TetR/AcrR family transcriptional regulator [Synechococcus sp. CCAP 1479/9]|uniref:TetR/AcrR family transcriptional regulator n=1 Tax=Synechococcus sp. CCAP 1479/9 TaxID=1221593 RepID=UPI001C212E0D|nr:TetR/AcrR family transcriptional regulator [Synechococcus sp. CCAP 1479/9]